MRHEVSGDGYTRGGSGPRTWQEVRLAHNVMTPSEVRAVLGLSDDPEALTDQWRDSVGCWADVWWEAHHEYLSCDRRPDPDSELGLCAEHEAKMQQLKEAS